ncbi:hypothetical protein [Solilutibacter pythonis]|nr:hypothetical protein [Lysobacter pythonis]
MRAILVALLSLVMVVQPLLAAIGEFHELNYDAPVATHMQLDPAGGGQRSQSDEVGAGGAQHLLLHFAHCCGHLSIARLAEPEEILFLPIPGEPPVHNAIPVIEHAPSNLLRPPIRA